MVPNPSPLKSVSATDLVGVLLVLWVVVLSSLLTSGSDPTAPPSWWAIVGILLVASSVVVAYVLFRRAETRGERLGTVWDASPECRPEDHQGDPGVTRAEQEAARREVGELAEHKRR